MHQCKRGQLTVGLCTQIHRCLVLETHLTQLGDFRIAMEPTYLSRYERQTRQPSSVTDGGDLQVIRAVMCWLWKGLSRLRSGKPGPGYTGSLSGRFQRLRRRRN